MMLVGMAVLLTSCLDDGSDDPTPGPGPGGAVLQISGEISGNRTFVEDTIYVLLGRVAVVDGAVLTIEEGTIIKGEIGEGANASSLLIAQGGTLNVNGTINKPVIMTSISDEIVPGQIVGPNLLPTVNGLWGGLVILGRAPISADNVPSQIEGIPPSDLNGQYGGSDPADASGSISYLSIRHGGANIGEGNEINGLTLGGVGTGTSINYVEIVGIQDDGIECFGGTVDVSNILVWNQGDDAYDMDQGYSGTIDNFIYIGGADSDHGMELDGPEGEIPSNLPASFTLRNGSLKGFSPEGGEYIDFRSDVRANVENCYFFNFSNDADTQFSSNGVGENYVNELINLSDLQYNTSHLSEGNLTIDQIHVESPGDGEEELDIFTTRPLDTSIITTESPTVGADVTEFIGWTWASESGDLDDF